jgi:hypothetical protein
MFWGADRHLCSLVSTLHMSLLNTAGMLCPNRVKLVASCVWMILAYTLSAFMIPGSTHHDSDEQLAEPICIT